MGKKNILVLGATGFIGRNMAEFFSSNPDFIVTGTYLKSKPLNNPRIKMMQVDLTCVDQVNDILCNADIVIQAAATTSGAKDILGQPHIHVTDNAIMNSLIFRAAFEHNVSHLIFFSCSAMYPSSLSPLKETDFSASKKMHPQYFGIGWTKVYLEKMCEFFSRQGSTRYTAIRHSNIYGPHDKFDLERSHVFGATLTKVLHCANGKITVWGDGTEERDLLYISDLINFVRLVIKKQDSSFHLSNVGYGSPISISDLINKIIKISGKKIKIEYDASKPTIPTKLSLDCSEAKRLFGWEPKVSLDEGILKTIEWHKSNIPFN